jgi:hypothetical protein
LNARKFPIKNCEKLADILEDNVHMLMTARCLDSSRGGSIVGDPQQEELLPLPVWKRVETKGITLGLRSAAQHQHIRIRGVQRSRLIQPFSMPVPFHLSGTLRDGHQ